MGVVTVNGFQTSEGRLNLRKTFVGFYHVRGFQGAGWDIRANDVNAIESSFGLKWIVISLIAKISRFCLIDNAEFEKLG